MRLKVDNALLLASYAGKPEYDEEIVALVKSFQEEAGLSLRRRRRTGDAAGEKPQNSACRPSPMRKNHPGKESRRSGSP